MIRTVRSFCLVFSCIFTSLVLAGANLTRDLSVIVEPDHHSIQIVDDIRFSEPVQQAEFILNSGLDVRLDDGTLERLATSTGGLHTRYRATIDTPSAHLTLRYQGRPLFTAKRTHGGMPQGLITPQGVYLDRGSAWYALFDRSIENSVLRVTLPEQWQSVSIGRRASGDNPLSTTWTSHRPHQGLYLIANRFHRYTDTAGDTVASVYLLQDDAKLANRYLDAIQFYLPLYNDLIGSYPYSKFTVVENPWQTGYGMPSFTLLGSRVLRLPFIPHTSLPHEILHNWWGNGVWVNYAEGNWSEGLTAYLADHWLQERKGKGGEYRLKSLQRYSNYAARGQDSALIDFSSRHNESSQSIGYSKSLMLFHMIRRAMGDAAFKVGLRRVWDRHRFERIGFEQMIRTLVDGDRALLEQYLPWLTRTGAPSIILQTVEAESLGGDWQLTLQVAQTQAEPFQFDLPIAITVDGRTDALMRTAAIDDKVTTLSYRLADRPQRVDVDPRFDLLRVLEPTEQPPALNRLFGGREVWLVLPTGTSTPLRSAWEQLANGWLERFPGLRVIDDIDELPPMIDKILLGWDNRRLAAARELFVHDRQTLTDAGLTIGGHTYAAHDHAVVLVSSDEQGRATGFIGANEANAIAQLARRLPHYGSYGRLIFAAGGRNLRKDLLSAPHSRLTRHLRKPRVPLRLPVDTPLGSDFAPISPAAPVSGTKPGPNRSEQ